MLSGISSELGQTHPAYIVPGHMNALSHATQSRKELAEFIAEKQLAPKRVPIPEDGESHRY